MEFEDNRDADDAVYELNGKELCGERVIVEHARGPRRDRDGYGGGYWGGGRSKCSLLQDTLSSLSPWGEVSMWTAKIDVLLLMFYLLFSYKLCPPRHSVALYVPSISNPMLRCFVTIQLLYLNLHANVHS